MPLVRTEEHKNRISDGMKAYYASAMTARVTELVEVYGMDVIVARLREELEAVIAPDAEPAAGTRRDLARLIIRMVDQA